MDKEHLSVVTKCEYYQTDYNWYYLCWYDGDEIPAIPRHVNVSSGQAVDAYIAVVRDIVTRPSIALACNPMFMEHPAAFSPG